MSNANNHGGARPGAGRPRKGDERRVSITFSVDAETAIKVRALRIKGLPVGERVETFINSMYHIHCVL